MSFQIIFINLFKNIFYIKIILNQEDPTKISRYLYYYGQFNQARLNIIHRIEAITKEISTTSKNIKLQTGNLQKLQRSYKNHRKNFLREQKNRQHFLAKTTSELQNKNQQLHNQLEHQQHHYDFGSKHRQKQ